MYFKKFLILFDLFKDFFFLKVELLGVFMVCCFLLVIDVYVLIDDFVYEEF